MSEPHMTKEQEALLEEAAQCAKLLEQSARELYELGEAFAAKWEKRLCDAEVLPTPNTNTFSRP